MADAAWKERESQAGADVMRQFERSLMLQTLDHHWRDHLSALDLLRQGIHLRGYAQKNPKQEYKRESFELFSDMLDRIKQDVVKVVLTVQVRNREEVAAVEEAPAVTNVKYQHAGYDEALAATPIGDDGGGTAVAAPPFVRAGAKVGRNDPCPCGSGKKFKQCHGRLA
jgi:preprotein translocase subunit SecA